MRQCELYTITLVHRGLYFSEWGDSRSWKKTAPRKIRIHAVILTLKRFQILLAQTSFTCLLMVAITDGVELNVNTYVIMKVCLIYVC